MFINSSVSVIIIAHCHCCLYYQQIQLLNMQENMITIEATQSELNDKILRILRRQSVDGGVWIGNGAWQELGLPKFCPHIQVWGVKQKLGLLANRRPGILIDIQNISFPLLKILIIDDNQIESLEPLYRMFLPSIQILQMNRNLISRFKCLKRANIPAIKRIQAFSNFILFESLQALAQMDAPMLIHVPFIFLPGCREKVLIPSVRKCQTSSLNGVSKRNAKQKQNKRKQALIFDEKSRVLAFRQLNKYCCYFLLNENSKEGCINKQQKQQMGQPTPFFRFSILRPILTISILFYLFNKKNIMNFDRVPRNDGVSCLREFCEKASPTLSNIHNKFYREVERCRNDRNLILSHIRCLASSYQSILLDLSVQCEGLQLSELSSMIMKMHLQKMSLIKWIFFKGVEKQPQIEQIRPAHVPAREVEMKKDLPMSYYYRLRQNSSFLAAGIDEELAKITNQINSDSQLVAEVYKSIFKNREIIEQIKPSQREQILLEAVQIIGYQSQMLKGFTDSNNQKFVYNYQDLKVKPYSKLKTEVDENFIKKVNIASEKLSAFLKSYIAQKLRKSIETEMINQSTQINLDKDLIEQHMKENAKKSETIQELTVALKFHKNLVEKLESLMKQKANYFEEQLMKSRFEQQRKNSEEIEKLKNTVRDLDANHREDSNACKSSASIDSEQELETPKTRRMLSPLTTGLEKHSNRIYRKSFKRAQNKGQLRVRIDSAQSISHESNSRKLALALQSDVITFQYESEKKFPNNFTYISRAYCMNINPGNDCINQNSCSIFRGRRKQSMLTIKNLGMNCPKSLQRNSQRNTTSIFVQKMRKSYRRLAESTLRHSATVIDDEDQPNSQQKKKQSGFGVAIAEKIQEVVSFASENSGQKQDQSSNQLKKLAKQATKINKLASNRFPARPTTVKPAIAKPAAAAKNDEIRYLRNQQKYKFDKKKSSKAFQKLSKNLTIEKSENMFEKINFEPFDGLSLAHTNKERLTVMMNELTTKDSTSHKYQNSNFSLTKEESNFQFCHDDLIDIYFSEEKAMEAQIQYGLGIQRSPNLETFFCSNLAKKMQKTVLYLRRNKQSQLLANLQNFLRYPYSSFQSKLCLSADKTIKQLSQEAIKDIVFNICSLHTNCFRQSQSQSSSLICKHLQSLCLKTGITVPM